MARVASEVPHPGVGAPWDGWARYEAAINRAYAEFPLWGLCAYDTRITPGAVLDDVARTHPHLATAHGRWVTRKLTTTQVLGSLDDQHFALTAQASLHRGDYRLPVRRSLVIRGRLFTVSDAGVLASTLDTLEPVGFAPFASGG